MPIRGQRTDIGEPKLLGVEEIRAEAIKPEAAEADRRNEASAAG
jgi:hypothetical protein